MESRTANGAGTGMSSGSLASHTRPRTTLLDGIAARLGAVLPAVACRAEKCLVSVTVSLAELGHLRPRALTGPHVYWARPCEGHYLVGIGEVATVAVEGERRFQRLEADFERLRRGWQELDPDDTGLRPAVFVGFSFSVGSGASAGRPDALLLIPAVTLQCRPRLSALVFSAMVRAKTDRTELLAHWLAQARRLIEGVRDVGRGLPPPGPTVREAVDEGVAGWVARVSAALGEIHAGALHKVVLSRRVRVSRAQPFRAPAILSWLADRYPDCAQFVWADAHGTLIGVSPERLVMLQQGRVIADALAGSAPRHSSSERDRALGAALQCDAKALREHGFVVEEIERVLKPLCRSLSTPRCPRLLQLPTVQHLWSPVEGRVGPEVSLLALARALHPTAAVSGAPRQAAIDWLCAHGEPPRGWYTGALGWLRPDGGGELAVVLRCGELQGCRAELSAGAGIVAGSDPMQELAETEWKLQAMMESLAAG